MLRSRVISGIDTERLASAVSRPGIDPRIWVSYAVLDSDPVVVTDKGEQDVIANITLLPSGTQETARVGAVYAGNGYGLYTPLYEGDEVLVVAPSGDPDQGLVITQRLWSPADLPPAEIADHPEDVTLVVQEGKNLRITTKGDGKVFLGSNAATKGVARLDDTTLGGSLSITAAFAPTPTPTSTLIFTYTPPGGGAPQVATLVLGVAVATPMSATLNFSGKIDSASETVVSI